MSVAFSPFMQSSNHRLRRGFTLLEMAIVLGIIGILIGGIMAGQELYRNTQLQSIAANIEQYKASFDSFKIKYQAVPGDMADATRYWGSYAGSCTAPATCSDIENCPEQATCNGDGDGRIASKTATRYEALRVWQHLSNAGMISGVYSGLPGPGGYSIPNGVGDHRIGLNTPQSRLKAVGYGIYDMGTQPRVAGSPYYPGEYGNSLIIGGQLDNYEPGKSVFTPGEAWSLDKKIDDGLPGKGRLMVRTMAGGGGNTCSNGTSLDGETAIYQVSVATAQCFFYYNRIVE